MIDYEKLDKLMELPVSEEMLGAYIEGNLSDIEADSVRQLISQNEELLDISLTNNFDSNIEDNDIELIDFQLPFVLLADSFNNDTTSIDLQEFENDNILKELNSMKTSHNLEAANRIFGRFHLGRFGGRCAFPSFRQGRRGLSHQHAFQDCETRDTQQVGH